MEKILKMLEELIEHCNLNHDNLWDSDLEESFSAIRDDGWEIKSKIQDIIKEVKKCAK